MVGDNLLQHIIRMLQFVTIKQLIKSMQAAAADRDVAGRAFSLLDVLNNQIVYICRGRFEIEIIPVEKRCCQFEWFGRRLADLVLQNRANTGAKPAKDKTWNKYLFAFGGVFQRINLETMVILETPDTKNITAVSSFRETDIAIFSFKNRICHT